MASPADVVRQFIHEAGNAVAGQRRTQPHPIAQAIVSDVTTRVAKGFLRELGVPASWGRHAGPSLVRDATSKRLQEIDIHHRNWSGRVGQALAGISVARRNLSTIGNSSSLVAGFAAASRAARPQTRFQSGARFLERLVQHSLVFNSEIPQLLKARQVEAAMEKRRRAELRLLDIPELAPGIDALKFPNRAAMHAQLTAFPEERTMLEGAMDTFLGDTAVRFRQAATSARSALEGVGKKVTGAQDWKQALRQRTHREIAKMCSSTYELLSSLTHPGRKSSASSTELAIKQAVGLVVWLDQNRNALGVST